MLKYNEPNMLNIFDLRKIKHCPPHFEKVIFELSFNGEKEILNWIYENLEGRFYSGPYDVVSTDLKLVRKHCIAFESPGEASYFALSLTNIKFIN